MLDIAKRRPRLMLPSLEEIDRQFFTPPVSPATVDFEVTGRCPFVCGFCHGPDHALRDELDVSEWSEVFRLFTELGANRFVITGGEPLVRKDIVEILFAIVQRGCGQVPSITLSTTGSGLLDTKREVLELMNNRQHSEIGLPIDASSPQLNSMMRPRIGGKNSDGGLSNVIDVMRLIQAQYHQIAIKLRTVVTALNAREVIDIPTVLDSQGIHLKDIQWKIYQVNSHVGERVDDVKDGGLTVSRVQFSAIGAEAVRVWSDRFSSITVQPGIASAERYMFVDPLARVSTIKRQGNAAETVALGSLIDEPSNVLDAMRYSEYLPMGNIDPRLRGFVDMAVRL
jgi:sulfatase maturation enzyme AslB (radical SAM superfamily)